jgi:hypothetical protein
MIINKKESQTMVAKFISIFIVDIYRTKLRNSNPNIPIFYEGE